MDNLKDIQIKNLKPKDKAYKKCDGKGLCIFVSPSGAKYWRLKYRYANKEKLLTIGIYPVIILKEAREERFKALKQLSHGIDPSAYKQAQKLEINTSHKNTFEVIASEWFTSHMKDKSESHQKRTKSNLSRFLNPAFGKMPVKDITPLIVLSALKKIEKKGIIETAKRVRQTASQIFCYAVVTGRLDRDPTSDIKGALQKTKTKHFATILDTKEIGKLMLAIEGYQGSPQVTIALKISPYLMVRPIELRCMEWEEIKWDKSRWEIPAEKMKMREPHIVPLCRQVIEGLKELQPITEHRSKYVFPSARGGSRPMSDNAVRTALRSLGYSNEMIVPHGFRSMATTLLNEELEYRPDWIEQQLAHAVKDPNGRAYNRTKHIKQRTEMMQTWADYLDSLKAKNITIELT